MVKARILIVEDDGMFLELMRITLEDVGYTVAASAVSGEEALEKAEETRPDLVLLDIVLKGKMDGVTVAEILRERMGIPVVYVTGCDDDHTLERIKLSGPGGYVSKPFRTWELRATIEIALYRHQMEQKLKRVNEELENKVAQRTAELAEANAQLLKELSERKHAEEALRQSEEKYRGIFEHSSLGIFQSDARGRFISANRSLASMLGYESSRHVIASVGGISDHLDSWLEVLDALKGCPAEDGATVEAEFHRTDMTTGTANLHLRSVSDKDGNLLFLEGFVEDITERKRAEDQIRQSKEMLQKAFDGVSDVLIMLDQDGLVRMLNRAAKEYFRLPDYRQAIGKPCFEAFFGRSTPCESCGQIISAMKNYAGTFERQAVMDSDRLEQVVVYSVINDAGEQEATIVRITDITRARFMERQLLQSQKLASLGLLVAGIAHEINNPNSFIVFNLPILRDYLEMLMPIVDGYMEGHPDLECFGMPYDEFRKDIFKLLENMDHGCQRINRTVSGLKEFARRRDRGEKRLIELKQVIEKAVAICGTEMKKAAKTFEVEIPEEVPLMMIDPEAVEQVLVNLLINAAHASDKEDSWIRLSLVMKDRCPDRCIIEVKDNGCGMDEKTRGKIFDPFFTTKSTRMGTGLGLYVCQSLVEGMGGSIEVESVPNTGTTFRVILYDTELK